MALPIITVDDFKGWGKISGNQFREEKLTEYISLFMEKYLRDIIGDGAFLEIVNIDLQKWTDLIEGVDYLNVDGLNFRNDGIKEQLVKFIYFEFVRDDFSSSQVGKVKGSNENSEKLNGPEVGAVVRARYNSGIRELHQSVLMFLANYDQINEPITGFVDNLDNTYTINVASTLYLIDGDQVNINGVDFDISGLISDTSFLIDAGDTGLSFNGNAVYKPYKLVEFDPLQFSTL